VPSPSRKTKARINEMRRLYAKGSSNREIGEVIGVSHATIKTWLAEDGLEGNGGHGARAKRKRVSKDTAEAAFAEAAAAGEEIARRVGLVTGEEAAHDAASAHEHQRERLQQVSRLADLLAQGVAAGEANPATLAAVMKLEQDAAERVVVLAPRTPQDPARDPHNIKAVDETRQKLARLVERHEQEFRCAHCGQSPYPKPIATNGHAAPAPTAEVHP